ncbi:suppressor of tumorigenicity 14 protein-like isoform X2 [Centruroides vittatus]|uniref:suppressor of tumorigenicity 14 protein-like isoform X2 n=1 Tax=Centruroides vittatus TaxID=120091 RepID=UPI0035107174
MHQFLDAQIGLLVMCLLVSFTSRVYSFPSGDLCTMLNEYTYYIKVGEVGQISVGNESFPSNQNGTSTAPTTCMVELVTCPSCHISVSFLHINISTCSQDNSCRCSYVQIVEPSYDHVRRHLCGYGRNSSLHHVESQTKVTSIRYTRKSAFDSFTLQFIVLNNIYTFQGTQDYSESNGTGTFQSPYFPQIYPSDYVAEYRFHNLNVMGCVQIIFTDFRISPWSYIEVLDTNRTRIAMYDGNIFRPPVTVSTGPNLTLYFKANDDYPNSGFRAKYAFFADAEKCQVMLPSTECGGSLENHGGVITLSKTNTDQKMQIYDCVWIIHPKFTYTYETYLALRIAQFKNMGQKSTLEIRQGITSTSRLLYTARGYHQKPSGQELIVSASSGYYLRFSGCFGNNSFMSIVYSTFTYNECHHTQEYRCKNGRCIKKQLRCDGFNHCGDKSDESSCFTGTSSGRDTSWWQSFSPKLYYPKQDGGGSGNPTTLILIASIAGFGMFVWTFATVLTKLQKKRRTPNIREAVHTISGDVDGATTTLL